jgi:NADP-dependent 3-hydroxy acid dehydrogenase YdfG
MAARRFDRLKAIAAEIEASGGRAYPLATDATQAYDLKRMVEAAEEQYGRLDYAVNNAGVSGQGSFMDMAVEDQHGWACGCSRDVLIRNNQMGSDRPHQERSA